MVKKLIIDPPSGWRYGFPRQIPDEYFEPMFKLNRWLVSVGYPQELIDQFPDGVPCRFWEEEDGSEE